MIVVELNGGLGNQLFQYAAGRSLAYRHNTDLYLYTGKLDEIHRGVTTRYFELNNFKHKAKTAPKEMKIPLIFRYIPWISRMVGTLEVFVERGQSFNSAYIDLKDNIYLVGYWQSYRYFQDISNIIFSEFLPRGQLSEYSRIICDKIINSKKNTIAIHVRRGDYVSNKSAASYHGALSGSYYRRALDRIFSCLSLVEIYVFSDDLLWCQSNLPLQGRDVCFVDGNNGADAWQDLILMAHCNHHIIANSSFSWWGAWLADQRIRDLNRIVIAPIQWFSTNSNDTCADRLPPHWLTL